MDLLFVIVLFVLLVAIYDMIKRTNKNIIEQSEEIKKMHDNLRQHMKK